MSDNSIQMLNYYPLLNKQYFKLFYLIIQVK